MSLRTVITRLTPFLAAAALPALLLIPASSAPLDTTADRAFGQGDRFTTGSCNEGGISAGTLCYSFDAAVDTQGNLYASDSFNNRVLEYDSALAGDAIADRVFGQGGSFTSNSCNSGSFGSPPTAETLCGPQGVAVDGYGNLYVADYNNNRVLEYDNPLASDLVPDRVFGQAGNFITGACNMGSFPSAATLCGPHDVILDSAGNLYIAEGANNRVLQYDNPLATDTVADRVFGQFGSFSSNGCNTGGRGSDPDANTMCFPVAVAVDKSGNLYIADRDNSRVLVFDDPLATDTVADRVIGQPDFVSKLCNAGVFGAPTANTLCWPQGVAVDGADDVYVADTGNHRVLEFDSSPVIDSLPDRVFGQGGSYATSTCNTTGSPTDPPTASTLCTPSSAVTDISGNLYVADSNNNRVLVYSAAPLPTPGGTPVALPTPGGTPVAVGGIVGLSSDTTGISDHSRRGDTRFSMGASLVAIAVGLAGIAMVGSYVRLRRQ